MIISHSKQFIFFAVPKTATHSIRAALSKHLSDEDWQQQALFKNDDSSTQCLPIPEIAKLGHGHISVQEIMPFLEHGVWNSYLKFAFVRNPFERFISVCFFLNRNNPDFSTNSLSWMKAAIKHERFQQRVLVRPQYQQLASHSGDLAMDVVGRYEMIQESLDSIFSTLGLEEIALGVQNSSEHNHFRSHYDAELQGLVEGFYQEDLDQFGYSF